jgi:hypothetical protein
MLAGHRKTLASLRQAVIIGERAHYPRCAGSPRPDILAAQGLRAPRTIGEVATGLPEGVGRLSGRHSVLRADADQDLDLLCPGPWSQNFR